MLNEHLRDVDWSLCASTSCFVLGVGQQIVLQTKVAALPTATRRTLEQVTTLRHKLVHGLRASPTLGVVPSNWFVPCFVQRSIGAWPDVVQVPAVWVKMLCPLSHLARLRIRRLLRAMLVPMPISGHIPRLLERAICRVPNIVHASTFRIVMLRPLTQINCV